MHLTHPTQARQSESPRPAAEDQFCLGLCAHGQTLCSFTRLPVLHTRDVVGFFSCGRSAWFLEHSQHHMSTK